MHIAAHTCASMASLASANCAFKAQIIEFYFLHITAHTCASIAFKAHIIELYYIHITVHTCCSIASLASANCTFKAPIWRAASDSTCVQFNNREVRLQASPIVVILPTATN